MKVDVYVDVVCPWCYIGERRFARALADFPHAEEVELSPRPYLLDPAAPARAVPLREYLAGRYGPGSTGMMEQVGAAGAGEGIAIDWDRALSVNTRAAHRLLGLAGREHGGEVQRALLARLFAAHFTFGEDVGDHATLARHAAVAGMPEERARAYLDAGEGSAELDAALREARELGIRAVPTFVFDERYAVSGAQASATFRQVLEEVRRRAA